MGGHNQNWSRSLLRSTVPAAHTGPIAVLPGLVVLLPSRWSVALETLVARCAGWTTWCARLFGPVCSLGPVVASAVCPANRWPAGSAVTISIIAAVVRPVSVTAPPLSVSTSRSRLLGPVIPSKAAVSVSSRPLYVSGRSVAPVSSLSSVSISSLISLRSLVAVGTIESSFNPVSAGPVLSPVEASTLTASVDPSSVTSLSPVSSISSIGPVSKTADLLASNREALPVSTSGRARPAKATLPGLRLLVQWSGLRWLLGLLRLLFGR